MTATTLVNEHAAELTTRAAIRNALGAIDEGQISERDSDAVQEADNHITAVATMMGNRSMWELPMVSWIAVGSDDETERLNDWLGQLWTGATIQNPNAAAIIARLRRDLQTGIPFDDLTDAEWGARVRALLQLGYLATYLEPNADEPAIVTTNRNAVFQLLDEAIRANAFHPYGLNFRLVLSAQPFTTRKDVELLLGALMWQSATMGFNSTVNPIGGTHDADRMWEALTSASPTRATFALRLIRGECFRMIPDAAGLIETIISSKSRTLAERLAALNAYATAGAFIDERVLIDLASDPDTPEQLHREALLALAGVGVTLDAWAVVHEQRKAVMDLSGSDILERAQSLAMIRRATNGDSATQALYRGFVCAKKLGGTCDTARAMLTAGLFDPATAQTAMDTLTAMGVLRVLKDGDAVFCQRVF